MKISIIKFSLLVIVYLSSYHAFGYSYQFKGITKADGLSDLLVNVIYQDSTGFIWLGTGKGLDRFDGAKVKHYPFEKTIDNQRIRINTICETASGQIWVGNNIGLWKLDKQTGNLFRTSEDILDHPVNSLLFDGEKYLYVGTDKGFYVSDLKNIQQIVVNDDLFSLSNNIKGMTLDDDGMLWLATGVSILMYNPRNYDVKEFKYFDITGLHANFRNITYLKNKLYIGSFDRGIVCFDLKTSSFSDFIDLGSNIISSISTDGEDMIYASTDGNGVFFLSQIDEKIVHSFYHDINNPGSIRSNSVYSLFVDDLKRVWIGFYQDGFDYSLYQSGLFSSYTFPPSFDLDHLTVRSFVIKNNHKLIGTRDGLYFIDENSNSVKYFNRTTLKSDLILSLTYYNEQYLIGTYSAGLYILNPNTLEISRIDTGPDFLAEGHVFCFQTDPLGNLWIGTSYGVVRFNITGNDVDLFTSITSSLPEGNVYDIFFDSSGKGWICCEKGLALIDPVNGNIKTNLFPTGFFNKEKIRMIFEDSKQRLYFLPEKGNYFVSDINMQSFSIKEISRFPNISIYMSGVEDDSNCLWFASDAGLTRLCGDNYSFYTYMDGIPDPVFTHNAVFKDENGLLWFGNAKGLVYVDPNDIEKENVSPYHLVLSDILINGRYLTPHDMESIQDKGYIELKNYQNNLIFHFSELSYSNPETVLHEIKMEGLENEWNLLSGKNEVSYFNLKPGSYKFNIRKPGDQNSEFTLNVRINKPEFYRYIFVFTLIFLFVMVLLYLLYKKKGSGLFQVKPKNDESDEASPEEKKYKMKRLEEHESVLLYEKLSRYMVDEKPYMNSELRIGDLANALDVSSHSISYLLNQHYDISYNDFINEYRVDEFKRMITEMDSSKYTLSALADMCGFSSRASFFRSFKKNMGITPNEYIKSLKRDNRSESN